MLTRSRPKSQRASSGAGARYAVECGAFDTLQTSVNVAEQEPLTLTLPLAIEREMGVIAKRPIANAVMADRPSRGGYGYEYWRRLQKLDYEFMKGRDAVATALRFTLTVPGVHTAIVGTARPGRFEENARHVEVGKLPAAEVKAIRARWSEVADDSWVGQT